MRLQLLTTASTKMAGMLHHVLSQKLTDVSEVLTASIIRAMSRSYRLQESDLYLLDCAVRWCVNKTAFSMTVTKKTDFPPHRRLEAASASV
jgi:hypothetical protein